MLQSGCRISSLVRLSGYLASCSVNLCFCTSGEGIDGSGRCFLEYEDSLHTTDIIILTESKGTERQTDRMGRVLRPYRGI